MSSVELGRERAAADARRVRLGDAEHVVDQLRPDARAGARPRPRCSSSWSRTDRCRGRCRAARPARPRTAATCRARAPSWSIAATSATIGASRAPARASRRASCAKSTGATLVVLRRARSCGSRARARASRRSGRDRAGPAGGSRGARPCPRTPDRCRGRSCRSSSSPRAALARLVERDVVRQDQRAGGRDAAGGRARATPAPSSSSISVEQRVRRQHDAVADVAGDVRAQDARRDQVKHGLLAADDERVAGVVAALEAHDALRAGRSASRRSCPCPRRPTGCR